MSEREARMQSEREIVTRDLAERVMPKFIHHTLWRRLCADYAFGGVVKNSAAQVYIFIMPGANVYQKQFCGVKKN